MQTIRLIFINLKKSIASYGFSACVLLSVVLFIASPLYHDYNLDSDISILQVYLSSNRSELLNDIQLCSYSILRQGVSAWLKMFIPMITSFSFVSLQCTERSTGSLRFSGIRLPKQKYQTGTFISAMIIGGLILVISFMIFSVCIALAFPDISEYDISVRELYANNLSDTYKLFNKFGYPYLITLRFIEMFFYGAFSAVPACFMMCLLKNKYLVISIPFFLKYMLLQHISHLRETAYEDIENINEKLISFLKIIDPDLISRAFSGESETWKNILFYSILILIAFIIYSIIMNRRWDYAV